MKPSTFFPPFAALVIASSATWAQDPRGRVGNDIPTLGSLFNREEKIWLSLDEEAAPMSEPSSDQLGFRERWLMSALKERFKEVEAVEAVSRVTVRHDGVTRTSTTERGIEVRGRSEALARVREFFERFRAGSKKTVTIEVRVLGIDDEPALSEPTPAAAVSKRQFFDQRVKDLSVRGSGMILLSPTIRVFANQTAKASVGDLISYVKDFNVEVVQDRKIADPVVGVIAEGFELELAPVLDPDGGGLIVSGSLGFTHLVRPIPEQRLKLLDAEVTVQLPSVGSHRWNGEVKLGAGQDAFRISGLEMGVAKSERTRKVEVWCLVTVEDGAPSGLVSGVIVDRDDKHGNVFVSFPREYVPDDPWNKAPKEVTVYRGAEPIGKAHLAGGWVLGEGADPKRSVIAIYQLAEGTPRDGDSVR